MEPHSAEIDFHQMKWRIVAPPLLESVHFHISQSNQIRLRLKYFGQIASFPHDCVRVYFAWIITTFLLTKNYVTTHYNMNEATHRERERETNEKEGERKRLAPQKKNEFILPGNFTFI